MRTLVISFCSQATLTGAGDFVSPQGIRELGMYYNCMPSLVAAVRAQGTHVKTRQQKSVEALPYTFDERGWGE